MTTDSHFAYFLERMDGLMAAKDDPHVIADETGDALAELLEYPGFLETRFRQPAPGHYRQHLVHVHPRGSYSVVSLVWRPGQATPIHDHRCWCVVGVLQGRELETRYHLYRRDELSFLVPDGESVYGPGQVCRLVPPDEDIHRVSNAGAQGVSISIHVYGTDIGVQHTSINHVFEQPVMEAAAGGSSIRAAARRCSTRTRSSGRSSSRTGPSSGRARSCSPAPPPGSTRPAGGCSSSAAASGCPASPRRWKAPACWRPTGRRTPSPSPPPTPAATAPPCGRRCARGPTRVPWSPRRPGTWCWPRTCSTSRATSTSSWSCCRDLWTARERC